MIITYFCYLAIYYIFCAIPAGLVMALTISFSKHCESIPGLSLLSKLLTVISLAIYLFIVPWVAHLAARIKTYEDLNFTMSLSSAVTQVRMHLGFLPLIGNFIAPKDMKDKNPQDREKDQ